MLHLSVSPIDNTDQTRLPDSKTSLSLDRHSRLVLLVDDDALVRAVLREVLQRAGYRVLCAADGPSALQLYGSYAGTLKLDMVVTDFAMPQMNGFELAVSLTELHPGLPMLIISGTLPENLPLQQVQRRGWHYLAKPVQRETMLLLLDGYCLGFTAASTD